MQMFKRFHYNFALQHAVELANELNKPLLIYEGLSATYPWASDRFHTFILEGMKESVDLAAQNNINYLPYAEPEANHGKGLLYNIAKNACAVVTDDYPAFIMTEHNEKASKKVPIPYIVVDSNGLIPFSLTDKAPYSAYFFRKIMQRHFVDSIRHLPEENPLSNLKNRETIDPGDFLDDKYLNHPSALNDIPLFVSQLNINHDVTALPEDPGTREAAVQRWKKFTDQKMKSYDDQRNDPDKKGTSEMSAYLHFGKISEFEMVEQALRHQPRDWSYDDIKFNKGSKGEFFNGNDDIASFLDELITWRETGFHFNHHTPNYDELESLPDWALTTLREHENDEREYIYSLDEFEQSKTHDEIWNAAQRQLVREGRIHNYLRMLWGKKILEWTATPDDALEIMIELNNKYALDGRDPNSYSGIFWTLGRFDRAWQERPVYGKIRYMTSASTRKKVKLEGYLKRYGK
jgi:deoxyribodipyrimidine photo-lyase